jgi:protein-disulfide isomerase
VAVVFASLALVAISIAVSSRGGHPRSAATGGTVHGVASSRALFAGIPQHGNVIGRPNAPVSLVEFADLQCPYCDEYAVRALPTLVRDYVRTGEVQMRFENLSFIGPDSVRAGRMAAAAADQNRLWNFVDLFYLNQGEENTGYVTPSYLNRLLDSVPGLDVRAALAASRTTAAATTLEAANQIAAQDGVNATPTFLIGKRSGPLRVFQPSSLTPAPFAAELNRLLAGTR